MPKESHLALNDIIDVLEELTILVEELNPGASEQLRRIKFLIDRADKCVSRSMAYE